MNVLWRNESCDVHYVVVVSSSSSCRLLQERLNINIWEKYASNGNTRINHLYSKEIMEYYIPNDGYCLSTENLNWAREWTPSVSHFNLSVPCSNNIDIILWGIVYYSSMSYFKYAYATNNPSVWNEDSQSLFYILYKYSYCYMLEKRK